MTYKTENKIFVDSNGALVEEGSPYAVRMLANAGDTIPVAQARELGLMPDEKASTTKQPSSTSTTTTTSTSTTAPSTTASASAGAAGDGGGK